MRMAVYGSMIAPHQPHHTAADLQVAVLDDDRLVGGIGRLQPDASVLLAVEALDGGFTVDGRYDDVAVARIGPLFDEDDVTVENAFFHHRIPRHPKRVAVAFADQALRDVDRVVAFDRFDR